jgi:hypothetical protein
MQTGAISIAAIFRTEISVKFEEKLPNFHVGNKSFFLLHLRNKILTP